MAMLSYVAAAYLNAGVDWQRWGTAHGSIVPYQVMDTLIILYKWLCIAILLINDLSLF